jgi:hypothetical protein
MAVVRRANAVVDEACGSRDGAARIATNVCDATTKPSCACVYRVTLV